MRTLRRTALAAVFVLGGGASAAMAGDMSAADVKKIHDYTLSMDKIHAMQAALADFKALEKKDPAFKAEAEADDGDDNDHDSIAQLEAKMDKHPRLIAIYRKHGLSDADIILMPLALMGAGVAVQYPKAAASLADQTSPQQIAFFKAHQAELKSMSWDAGKGQ